MTLQHIDSIRITIDRLIQNAVVIKTSAETTLAWRSLQMAKSWLGKMKGELGSQTPYAVADKAENIPPTAEVYEGELRTSGYAKLDAINWMRQEIESVTNDVKSLNKYEPLAAMVENYRNHALQHLSEARFWYGFELANIRESEKQAA